MTNVTLPPDLLTVISYQFMVFRHSLLSLKVQPCLGRLNRQKRCEFNHKQDLRTDNPITVIARQGSNPKLLEISNECVNPKKYLTGHDITYDLFFLLIGTIEIILCHFPCLRKFFTSMNLQCGFIAFNSSIYIF